MVPSHVVAAPDFWPVNGWFLQDGSRKGDRASRETCERRSAALRLVAWRLEIAPGKSVSSACATVGDSLSTVPLKGLIGGRSASNGAGPQAASPVQHAWISSGKRRADLTQSSASGSRMHPSTAARSATNSFPISPRPQVIGRDDLRDPGQSGVRGAADLALEGTRVVVRDVRAVGHASQFSQSLLALSFQVSTHSPDARNDPNGADIDVGPCKRTRLARLDRCQRHRWVERQLSSA